MTVPEVYFEALDQLPDPLSPPTTRGEKNIFQWRAWGDMADPHLVRELYVKNASPYPAWLIVISASGACIGLIGLAVAMITNLPWSHGVSGLGFLVLCVTGLLLRRHSRPNKIKLLE